MSLALDQILHSPTQLDPFTVACLFGSADPALLPWVEASSERFLVFLEEDETAFLKAKTSPLAEHPRVRICYVTQPEVLKQIAWEFVFLSWGYFVLEGASVERAQSCFAELEHYHQGVDLLASEYKDHGVQVLSNVFANLDVLSQAKKGPSLEGVFEGRTAIVCGAGPTLSTLAPQLRALQDRALILAGGSAIKALSTHGVHPHMMAALDPEALLECAGGETPFFYQSRVNHEMLHRVQGPRIWMPSQSTVPLESYMLGACGLYAEPFDTGWTVANFCAALAVHLGCERVLFAGVDFVCGPDSSRKDLIEIQPQLYSRKDWLMSADWMRSFVCAHPRVQWGNLALAPLNLLEVPLVSVPDLPLVDFSALVHAAVTEAEACAVSSEQIQQVRASVRQSFETSLNHCETLLTLWQHSYPASPLETPRYILVQHDLEQKICYSQCLAPLWEVWRHPILRGEPHPLAQQLHRLLFFKQLIETHLSYLRVEHV